MIKKIGKLVGQIDCKECLSLIQWDSADDIKTSNGIRYVVCPNCGNEWFYPTVISNGWLLLISYMAYKGTGYFRTLSSDGYGAFTEHNYQLS